MDFVNQSGVSAGWTVGFDRDGRELVVVVVKATFQIPQASHEPELAPEQAALVEADTFTGEPGKSAPLFEVDFAHRKPACDVLLNGSAWAPAGRAVTAIAVGLKVGAMSKAFMVVGDRVWKKGLLGVSAADAQPFASMPISYDNAFGGVDAGQAKTYLTNPVGRGFAPSEQGLAGQLLPNTEELGKTVGDPAGSYRPMSFGPVGRNWLPRSSFAGTYDDAWVAERAPFWPDDFDDRYFQAAPADQQIPFPRGGEEVVLKNLTPDGHVAFRLPSFAPPVLFVRPRSEPQELRAVTDTVLIEPDRGTFSMTARVSLPMRKSCFDLRQVVAGRTTKEWLGRQRFGSKPYYNSLAELVRARKR